MMQLWENGKNPNFGPNLRTQKIFSWVSSLLVVTQSYNTMQFPGKLTNEPNKKMTKKTDFGQDPDPFGSNLGPKIFCGFYL